MDDLVVIILTLIIAGAGVIGQIKKKKQISETGEEQKKPEDIWDLFKEEVFPAYPNAEQENLNIEQEEFEPFENEQGYKFEAKNEGGLLVNNELKATHPVKEVLTKKEDGFSLKKAVIYSEILNRKYI